MNAITDNQSDILMLMPVDLEIKATDILPAAQRVNKRYTRQFISGALISMAKKDIISRVTSADGQSSAFVRRANGQTKAIPAMDPKPDDKSLQLGERVVNRLVDNVGKIYTASDINLMLGLEHFSTKVYAVLDNLKSNKQLKQFDTKPRTYKVLPGIVKGWIRKGKKNKPAKSKAAPPVAHEQQMTFEVFEDAKLEKIPTDNAPVDFGSAINSMIALREQNEKYKQALEMIANILHQAAPDLFE